MILLHIFCLIVFIGGGTFASECVPRWLSDDKMVCVCNADECDEPGRVETPPKGQFLRVVSSLDGLRFQQTVGSFQQFNDTGVLANATIDRNTQYQSIFGFGGAMTDSVGINMALLSNATKERLMRAYFSPEGIQYNMIRVPIGGTDFSTRLYSYVDTEGDDTLSTFELAEEDHIYKIPNIKRAQELSEKSLKIVAAPWSAPKWMKTNNEFYGLGKLKPEYYQTWADYMKLFVEYYAAEGVPIWGLSTQNEPSDGLYNFTWNCMGYTASELRDWTITHLAPTIATVQNQPPPHIHVYDDHRSLLSNWIDELLGNETLRSVVQGVSMHWYSDVISGPGVLDQLHNLAPELYLLYTEACNGVTQAGQAPVDLGSWLRGELYAKDIIEVLNHWGTGWIDWNIVLDETGGPTWAANNVDSPIIVNGTTDEFYKQPMFYVMGHFSRFLPEGSRRVLLNFQTDSFSVKIDFFSVAFVTPEGNTVIILCNRLPITVPVLLQDPDVGSVVLEVRPNSIETLQYTVGAI